MYRVILTCNGVYKKTLYACQTKETAFLNFHEIKEKNKVLYPKKYINTKGIKTAKFELCVTKIAEDGDTYRLLRDEYGRTYQEKKLGDWVILDSTAFDIEETFWMYGHKSKGSERPTIKEILKKLLAGAYKKNMVKEIIVVHNKVIIYSEEQFDMIICKCLLDAQRLHHTLAKLAKKQKLKNLLFLGTATPGTISRMYQIIHEETGWPYIKIRRTSTRP